MSDPLRESDVERAFGIVIPGWQLERLDTRMGTADCARYLKSVNQVLGCTTVALDDEGQPLTLTVMGDPRGSNPAISPEASEEETTAGSDGTVAGDDRLDGSAERLSRPATSSSEASDPASRPDVSERGADPTRLSAEASALRHLGWAPAPRLPTWT